MSKPNPATAAAPSTSAPASNAPAAAPVAKKFVPKVAKLVTLPTLTLKTDVTYYLQFISKIEQSKVRQIDPKTGQPQEAAHIAQVVNLETGEANTLIVNAVLMSIMNEEFPNDSYVQKGFGIQVVAPKAGKRYKAFTVSLLDLT